MVLWRSIYLAVDVFAFAYSSYLNVSDLQTNVFILHKDDLSKNATFNLMISFIEGRKLCRPTQQRVSKSTQRDHLPPKDKSFTKTLVFYADESNNSK